MSHCNFQLQNCCFFFSVFEKTYPYIRFCRTIPTSEVRGDSPQAVRGSDGNYTIELSVCSPGQKEEGA